MPEACELVDMVRVEDPATAVMVTELALVDCHVSVTLCPLLIAVVLVVRETVGADDDGLLELPQEQPRKRANRIKPQEKGRRLFRLMCLCAGLRLDTARGMRCPRVSGGWRESWFLLASTDAGHGK